MYVVNVHITLQAHKNNGTLHEDQCTFMMVYTSIGLTMTNVFDYF